MPRLSRAKVPFGKKLPGSPAGYTCHANPAFRPLPTGTPWGICVRLGGGRAGFAWAPAKT